VKQRPKGGIYDKRIDMNRIVWRANDEMKEDEPSSFPLFHANDGEEVYETRDEAFQAMIQAVDDRIAHLQYRRDLIAERRAKLALGIVPPEEENDIPF
jgi:hypothetical protein